MRYLKTEEVSKLLNCTRITVLNKVKGGELTPINPYHKTGYLFEHSKIDEYLKTKKEVQNA